MWLDGAWPEFVEGRTASGGRRGRMGGGLGVERARRGRIRPRRGPTARVARRAANQDRTARARRVNGG